MDVVTIVRHLTAVKLYTTGSYAIALYEYIITFDREVETFWKRRFTFPTFLWFLNRYTLYCSLFPTLLGFHIPLSEEVCVNFVKFPGAMQIISNVASGSTLSLRVYALYGRAWWVVAVLLPVFVAEIALEGWAVAGGVPAQLPPGVVGCILTGKPSEGDKFAAFWIGQLVFPTLIFIMTLARAVRLQRFGSVKGSLINVMLRDGVMYFLVIFSANLANVVTYSVAPEDLKFANAPFTNVITTLMICRLMLNLRRDDAPDVVVTNYSMAQKFDFRARLTYLGDLGADIDINDSNDKDKRRETIPRYKSGYPRAWGQEESGLELETYISEVQRT
ncbi:uncharacterized protein FOMMEDRAFT_148003 [Fomitiporia mediterranea MF3/22]|uniref:uncharacterized protein n=1 Tax=Fomitiporia mediterranea (strain MF3/22) TaxID=694068 RepID=UPI00044080F2|nr:uncharacterized protein FOMMEDRAFT_148003 [Fomitiporia mediterranea MF3/22]EJD01519.1 hypothetical protein FOMMEDRAFT_148003 [Fomitiporia mediterranea MF3/22]